MQRHLASAVLISALALAAAARAEPSKFKEGQVDTLPAARFTSSGGALQITLKQPLTISLRNLEKVTHLADVGLQIRVFRLGSDGKPVEWEPGFPPCHIFITQRWTGVRRNELNLYFGGLDALTWLSVAPDGRLVTGRWMLVFEDGSDDHDILRLTASDLRTYFDGALTLIIDPDRAYTVRDLAPFTPQQIASRQELLKAAATNSRDLACMRVRELVDAGTLKFARLTGCDIAADASAQATVTTAGAVGALSGALLGSETKDRVLPPQERLAP